MADVPCALCGVPLEAHFVVEAECRVRWRGNSFDAYEAQALLGVALAEVLGYDARSKADLDRFTENVHVKTSRAATDLNPEARFDPEEGETWAFHVAFRKPVDADLDACKTAAVDAVGRARNFRNARVA